MSDKPESETPALRANENLPEEFQAARIKLGRARPYIQRALWAVPVFMTDSAKDPSGHPTLGVDKYWRMYAHPEYVAKCNVDELATTIYHEVAGHLLSNHADRAEAYNVGLNHAIWNIAGDMAINASIERESKDVPQNGNAPLKLAFPAGTGIFPRDSVKLGCPKPFPDDWTAEAYYDELCKYAKKVGVAVASGKCGSDCGSGADAHQRGHEINGSGKDGKGEGGDGNRGLSPAEQELVRQAVAQEIVEHAKQKGRGTIPAHLLVWAEERFDPKVPWDRMLRALIRRALGAEVLGHQTPSFKRPSRRTAAVGGRVLLPTRWKPQPRVDVTIDTSGSMGADKRLGKALTEVDSLLQQQSAKVFVRSCDAAVTVAKRVMRSLANTPLEGGGGTDMRIGIQAGVESKPTPHLVVCVSDGETPWPEKPTPMPLVIVLVGDADARSHVPAWAHTVYVDDES